ncbi:diphthamide biosynthesis 3 isoform 2-T2 [Glossina fuscipes fuscipes]
MIWYIKQYKNCRLFCKRFYSFLLHCKFWHIKAERIKIEKLEYCEIDEVYYYPCPCGDRFEIYISNLLAGKRVAICPSCSRSAVVITWHTKMSVFHDEVEIEDFEYDEEEETYYYPCPCGDRFEISKLMLGEEIATCPSCSLVIKVIYDVEMFIAEQEMSVKIENKSTTALESN